MNQRASPHLITAQRHRSLPRGMCIPRLWRSHGVRRYPYVAQETTKAQILNRCRTQKDVQQWRGHTAFAEPPEANRRCNHAHIRERTGRGQKAGTSINLECLTYSAPRR